MRRQRLINYLPPVLRGVMEFEEITNAQQPEMDNAWDALNTVMDNQFIDTATNAGISMWEKELNIVPLVTDTLEDRRRRVKAAWNYGAVYTYNWLASWLKKSCDGNDESPIIKDYTLHVTLSAAIDYLHVLDDMRRYISANILIDPLIILTKKNMTYYAGAVLRCSVKQTITMEAWNAENTDSNT